MSTPSFHSDPHVQYLTQILEEIREGYIQIPRFQRPLVWSWERRLELLRSIRDGIPMGAIMVWRSPGTLIECYSFLGPHRLERPRIPSSTQYLLDGVQRLSTLYGALHKATSAEGERLPEEEYDDDPPTENFEVFYDLREGDFVRATDVQTFDGLMPLHLIFNSVEMLRFQRRISEESRDDEGFVEMVESSESVAKAFREYKVPIIPIVTDDVEMATRTFQRINSQGRAMSEAHMIHALSWGDGFDLNRKLDSIKRETLAEIGWQEIDSDALLKACKAALGFDVYRSDADEVGAAFRAHPAVIEEVAQGCVGAAHFLSAQCGVPRPSLVPYNLQIVLLADLFRENPQPADGLVDLLSHWFWATTYGEVFAGMSGDKFDVMLRELRQVARGREFQWSLSRPFEIRPYPTKFDFRAARAKAFAFRLAEARNHALGDGSGTALLDRFGRECVLQVLPRISAKKIIYSSYANRFLLHPGELSAFRERLLNSRLSAIEFDQHILDHPTVSALSEANHEEFLNERLMIVQDVEERFAESHYEPLSGVS